MNHHIDINVHSSISIHTRFYELTCEHHAFMSISKKLVSKSWGWWSHVVILRCVWFSFWLWLLPPSPQKRQKTNQRDQSSQQLFLKVTFLAVQNWEHRWTCFRMEELSKYMEELLVSFSYFHQTIFSFFAGHDIFFIAHSV
jgi:hypothetical protein